MTPEMGQALRRCKTLPTLPTVAVRLLELYERRDQLDQRQLTDVIGLDPATAARLIRLASSPQWKSDRPVTSLQRAVAVLGTPSALAVALGFALSGGRRRGDHDRFARHYFQRSLLSALAARTIAATEGGDPDEAFLAGLLQDIGMLALKEVLPTRYAGVVTAHLDAPHVALTALEQAEFGADHAEVGAELGRGWLLPALLTDTLAASHAPETAPEASRPLARVVWLSSLFADAWTQSDAGAASQRSLALMQERFGIEAARFDAVMAAMGGAIPALSEVFEVELARPGSIEGILGQAREALMQVSLEAAASAQSAGSAVTRLEGEKRAIEEREGRDALTGLWNRGRLEAALQEAFELAARTGEPLSVAFCDIDFFKRVNDSHGHQVGDEVLRAVASALSGAVRRQERSDVVGRLGGEEFVLVLSATDRAGAQVVAERARAAVAAQPFPTGRGPLAVTISIGVATLDAHSRYPDAAQLLAAADAALYAAKHAGRNRVAAA